VFADREARAELFEILRTTISIIVTAPTHKASEWQLLISTSRFPLAAMPARRINCQSGEKKSNLQSTERDSELQLIWVTRGQAESPAHNRFSSTFSIDRRYAHEMLNYTLERAIRLVLTHKKKKPSRSLRCPK
jgi:hypothetical protein